MKYAKLFVAMAALVALVISSVMILPALAATNHDGQLVALIPNDTGIMQLADNTWIAATDQLASNPATNQWARQWNDANPYMISGVFANTASPIPRYSPSASLVGTVDEYLYSIALATSSPANCHTTCPVLRL